MIKAGLLMLLFLAALSDIRTSQISNRLILAGLSMGILFRLWEEGPFGIFKFFIYVTVPIIVLFFLFLMRVLGAGDIKLFSMIGGIWGLQVLCTTIAVSFLAAAVMSLGKILFHKNLILRLRVFRGYMREVLTSGRLLKYPQEFQGGQHIIHFSIAILIGYAIAMEVVY